ncbi:catabolic L-serine/threonine dehydratase [Dispira parvispora]|uniref:L-serine ammonia-lyase n=1 Tax=Dispira parvispora TaxID=1520584 RepID=A0A9W8EAH1_9FUNG|nr:catabolic L-serine/threonine dehydratase [Dispira parvispora]
MAGPTGTRWYLLVLAISLLLYRHRVSGNLDDDIKYKGPESNDQLNKAVSVSPNRMGLEYICESNDQLNKAVSVSANRMGLEYICHQENSQQFCHETLHPSTHESITTSSPPMHPRKRIRIDSLSLPESGGAADPSVRLDGALGPASSPCTSEQPESDNTLSKPSQVNHHNDINSSRQCDYKIHPRRWHFRSDSNRVIRGLYCPLHQFLSDQYKLSDRVPSDPRRSLGYMSASYSPRSSLNDRTSRINTEVKNILQGNTHDRLGYEFPEDIANLGFMDKYLENAEAGCLAQRDQVHSGDSEDSNLDKTKRNAQHLVTASTGNAGLALAYAGRQLDVSTTVFLPTNTSPTIQKRIESEGATVRVVGESIDQTIDYAQKFASPQQTPSAHFIHPFDDPKVQQGHGTIIPELTHQLPDGSPDALLCGVGGGGLLAGIIMGLQEHSWNKVPVFAVETHGSNVFQTSRVNGELRSLTKCETLASSLRSKTLSSRAFELSAAHPVIPIAISDAMAANACQQFADQHQMMVEPACGAVLSLLYSGVIRDMIPNLQPSSHVVVVLAGGIDVSVDMLHEFKLRYSNPPTIVKSGAEIYLRLANESEMAASNDTDASGKVSD